MKLDINITATDVLPGGAILHAKTKLGVERPGDIDEAASAATTYTADNIEASIDVAVTELKARIARLCEVYEQRTNNTDAATDAGGEGTVAETDTETVGEGTVAETDTETDGEGTVAAATSPDQPDA
jgi:hypothetical protein